MTFLPLLGATPSKDDPKDAAYSFASSEVFAGAVPSTSDRPSVLGAHELREQRFQDCVGVSLAEVAQAFFVVAGRPQPKVSALFPYNGSRLLSAPPAPGALLPDVGCSMRNALKWNRDYGLASEKLWPETDENVGLTPPKDVRDAAASAKAVSSHRIIAASVEDLRNQLAAALRIAEAGQAAAPTFVMPVHDGYIDLGRAVYEAASGTFRGYHAQPIMEIDLARDLARVPGSWGKGFFDDGIASISIPCLFAIGSEFWVQVFAPDAFVAED